MTKIIRAKDKFKDQSYFLWQIKKKQLSKILLPIGEFENKQKVREFADFNNLITADKKDSQGLCFVGQTSLGQMLLQTIGVKKGLIINKIFGDRIPNFWGNNIQKEKKIISNDKICKKRERMGNLGNINSAESLAIEIKNLRQLIENLANLKKENQKNILIVDFEILEIINCEIREKKNFVNKKEFKNKNCLEKSSNKSLESNIINSKIEILNQDYLKSAGEVQKLSQKSNENIEHIWQTIIENKKQIVLKKILKKTENIEFFQILGLHSGAFLYTIGQRQNLNLSGGPWFVSETDILQNLVLVIHQNDINAQQTGYKNNTLEFNNNLDQYSNFGLQKNSVESIKIKSDFPKTNSIYCTKILIKNLNWQNFSVQNKFSIPKN